MYSYLLPSIYLKTTILSLPIKNVADEMQKLDDLTRVITASMNEMSAGALQINEATQEVNIITQKNKENIGNLVNEVERFKV